MVRGILFIVATGLGVRTTLAALIPVSQTLHVTASAYSNGTTVTDTPPDVVLGNDLGQHSTMALATLGSAYGSATAGTELNSPPGYIHLVLQTNESHPFSQSAYGNGSSSGTVSFMLDSPMTWQYFALGGQYASQTVRIRDHSTSNVLYTIMEGSSHNLSLDIGWYDLQFSQQSRYTTGQGGGAYYDASFSVIPEPLGIGVIALATPLLARRRRRQRPETAAAGGPENPAW